MHLGERLWAVVTTFVNLVTLSPFEAQPDNQTPLQPPSSPWEIKESVGFVRHGNVVLPASTAAVVESESTAVVSVPAAGEASADVGLNVAASGPIFHPPGTPANNDFKCNYSAMEGWEPCSSKFDRSCWLRRRIDGRRYDLFTNYENDAPIGVTRYYKLNLTDSWYAADGLNFTAAKFFNNTYPGPWIQACWGDRIVVNVTNQMKHNGTSVHWHGIRQNLTMHMDGVNGVTQCPIAPKDYFVYEFDAIQYGTSWYHSHYSVQYADGAAGPITIHGPTSAEYDEAISPSLIMTDWGHNTAFDSVRTNYFNNKTILLNGLGDVTKFNNVTNQTKIEPPFTVVFEPPKPGKPIKKYLLRIINTSFDTTFVFTIDNHMLQIVSADFVPIFPYANTSVLVGIGQRYNVIVEANPLAYDEKSDIPKDNNYWIRTYVAPCFGAPVSPTNYNTTGILRYNKKSDLAPSSKPWKDVAIACSDEDYGSLHPVLPWKIEKPANGGKYGEKFDLWRTPDGTAAYPLAHWSLDNEAQGFYPIRINYSNPIFTNLDNNPSVNPWASSWRVIPEDYTSKDWVFLAITGWRKGVTQGAHPIHLHGHDFAILEQANDKIWDPWNVTLNFDNPPRRDVVLLPKGGYVVIAFKTDNPGAWLVHCHIAFHISEGLGLQIMERQRDARSLWPKNSAAIVETQRVCKNWNYWFNNKNNWDSGLPRDCTEPNLDKCFQDDSGV